MWSCTEEELFRRARRGDRTAFDHLRQRLDLPVRRFIRRLVGRSDAEEDILQDAFIALYVHRNRIEPVGNYRPFLYRIVRNLCYGELRKKGRFRTVPLDDALDADDIPALALIDPRPGPEERTHWMSLYAKVQKAIHRLPELQRQTLILSCAEGMTHAQVAVTMATDAATVKSRLHLARETLKKQLHPETLDALGLRKENGEG